MCRKLKLWIWVTGVVVVSSVGSAQAAVIYDESVDGDLVDGLGPVLALTIGANTVVGSSHLYGPDSGFGDEFDLDPFSFLVPQGTRVTSVAFAFSTQLLGGLRRTTVRYRLSDANYQAITTSPDIDLFGISPVTLFDDVTPIPAGLYRWDEAGWGAHITTASTWTYSTTFKVAPVPVPAAFGLMTAGVALLRLRVRRSICRC